MRIVSHSRNKNRLYHGYDNELLYWYKYDHISYSQIRTSCLTVRTPAEASSRSSPTTPHASPHGTHTISHSTSYSPHPRRGLGSYSTGSASPLSWNRVPHRIHAHNPNSGTRTCCRCLVIPHAQQVCCEPTTLPPWDETPWTAGNRTHRRGHRKVCPYYNTHNDCLNKHCQVSSPVHAHTPYNQTNTSYYYSYGPPPPPPHSSPTIPPPEDAKQTSVESTHHRSRSHIVFSKRQSTA